MAWETLPNYLQDNLCDYLPMCVLLFLIPRCTLCLAVCVPDLCQQGQRAHPARWTGQAAGPVPQAAGLQFHQLTSGCEQGRRCGQSSIQLQKGGGVVSSVQLSVILPTLWSDKLTFFRVKIRRQVHLIGTSARLLTLEGWYLENNPFLMPEPAEKPQPQFIFILLSVMWNHIMCDQLFCSALLLPWIISYLRISYCIIPPFNCIMHACSSIASLMLSIASSLCLIASSSACPSPCVTCLSCTCVALVAVLWDDTEECCSLPEGGWQVGQIGECVGLLAIVPTLWGQWMCHFCSSDGQLLSLTTCTSYICTTSTLYQCALPGSVL